MNSVLLRTTDEMLDALCEVNASPNCCPVLKYLQCLVLILVPYYRKEARECAGHQAKSEVPISNY